MLEPKRWITIAALTLLAVALLMFAASQRYVVTPAGARTVMRTDRLTGTIHRCRVIRTSTALDCSTSDDEAAALRELQHMADSTR